MSNYQIYTADEIRHRVAAEQVRMAPIEAAARRFQERDPGLSREQAIAKAIDADPQLYRTYLTQRRDGTTPAPPVASTTATESRYLLTPASTPKTRAAARQALAFAEAAAGALTASQQEHVFTVGRAAAIDAMAAEVARLRGPQYAMAFSEAALLETTDQAA